MALSTCVCPVLLAVVNLVMASAWLGDNRITAVAATAATTPVGAAVAADTAGSRGLTPSHLLAAAAHSAIAIHFAQVPPDGHGLKPVSLLTIHFNRLSVSFKSWRYNAERVSS